MRIFSANKFCPFTEGTQISNGRRPGHRKDAFILDHELKLEPLALMVDRRPASEKRQGTKSRWGIVGGAATMGISPRAQASMWWNVAATWAILPHGMCVN